MSIITTTVILLLLMDPLGNLSSYLSLVEETPPSRRWKVVLREMGIALLAMLTFYVIGEFVLSTLKVSESTLRVTSGVILFLIALKILFPANDSLRANLPKGEPFVTPLAIPLIAGPALLATIMLFALSANTDITLLIAILIASALAALILLFASPIQKLLGQNGLDAFERMMGLVLVMLAIQRTLEGIQEFIPAYCK
jgi:multiple antibiotic resistance protein